MVKPDADDRQYLDRAIAAWNQFKQPFWRSYEPGTNDVKRLWAVALGSNWRGSGLERMEHLLTLLPLAIEQAAKLPAFGARTTLWAVCRDAKGIERLAGGIYAITDQDTIDQYNEQIVRVRLPGPTIILLHAMAKRKRTLVSRLVAEIIEAWVEQDPHSWGPDE